MSLFGTLRGMLGLGSQDEPPMSCGEMAERLFEYLDQELDEGTSQRVREHLDICAHCATWADFERAFLRAVESASEEGESAPDSLRLRVLAVLDSEESAPGPQ